MSTTERAKVAVATVFVLNGLAFASWVSRVPAIRDGLDLTPGQVGLLLLCLSAGTVVALPLSGAVVSRIGPARTILLTCLLAAGGLSVMAAGLAATAIPVVGVGMLVYGMGTSAWDVAMNVEGADVERQLDRTLMPRFHAGFSAGTVMGALLGAGCAHFDIGLPAQLVGTAVVVLAAVPVAVRSFTPVEIEDPDAERSPSVLTAWREPRTLMIGLVVLAFALCEGIANDWVALALVDGYDAGESLAAAGFAVFVTAMTLGRIFGGAVVERLGRVATLRITGVLVALGVAGVVWSPGLPGALAAAALWGVGASLGFPLGMSAAADDERRSAGRVAVVSSIGYTAFLGGPPLVGLLADSLGVRRAIVVAAIAGLAGALVARATAPQRVATVPSSRGDDHAHAVPGRDG
ncbi:MULTISPECIES: MFS transporter [Nocardioides]|uniref:MFS transporter n=1 Tax=Nocardioides vastitatis TaxID=2568655 RepID=A0ABW0ZIU9_9ACTN|nr:MFS transporter [Nocardioides sp.]THI96646.1 MFS transporter [Nocardioides sp.]